MPEYHLGMRAKAYYGNSGGTGLPSNELKKVKDVTLNLSSATADVTTRDNNGWRATVPTLKECSVDFTMQWDDSDPGFQAVFNAYLTGTPLRMAFLTEEGGSGPIGEFTITDCTRNEALEDGITADVTAQLSKFEQWKEAGTIPTT